MVLAGLVTGWAIAIPIGAVGALLVALTARTSVRTGSAAAMGVATVDGGYAALAVDLGVTPRPSTDVSTLPDPLPLSVVLADHRAGENSLFVYPWC